MKKLKSVIVNTRLTEVEYKLVQEVAEAEKEGNVSAAIRKIVREWDQYRKQNDNHKESRPTG
jgi:Flp pilus assembly protein CpaB